MDIHEIKLDDLDADAFIEEQIKEISSAVGAIGSNPGSTAR